MLQYILHIYSRIREKEGWTIPVCYLLVISYKRNDIALKLEVEVCIKKDRHPGPITL